MNPNELPASTLGQINGADPSSYLQQNFGGGLNPLEQGRNGYTAPNGKVYDFMGGYKLKERGTSNIVSYAPQVSQTGPTPGGVAGTTTGIDASTAYNQNANYSQSTPGQTSYSGNTTVKDKKTGRIVQLTGRGSYDTNMYEPATSGGQSPLNLTNQIQSQTQPQTQPQAQNTPASSYTGPSVVDYLKSVGKTNDFASRKTLATSMGIANYTGTAQQNTQLLGMLRAQTGGAGGGTSTQTGTSTTGGGTSGLSGSSSVVGTSESARTATREQEIQRIKDEMAAGAGPAPTAFNSVAEYDRLRREQGVVADEGELNAIHTEVAQAKEALNQFKQTSTGEISQGGYLANISEAERNLNFRMESLSLREQAVTGRLNTKNAYISNAINMGKEDYQTAKQNYDQEYNKNLKAIDMYNSELDDRKKDAMTGFQTISNLMEKSGSTTISPQLSAQLDTYANQLGIPTGMLQEALKGAKGSNIDNTKIIGKNLYMWTTDKNGNPHLKLLQSVSDGGNGGNEKDDIASAIMDFQNQMTSKGWAGANPDAYNHYRRELSRRYGANAALQLDKEMETLGITVDKNP